MIDQKLKAVLEARGQWNADSISRKARMRTCRGCSKPVMAGLDADVAGKVAHCDPTPLTTAGEVAAVFSNLATYSLRWVGGNYLIDFRDQYRIKGSPAGSDPHIDVINEHRCGIQFTNNQITQSNVNQSNIEKGADNEKCPY